MRKFILLIVPGLTYKDTHKLSAMPNLFGHCRTGISRYVVKDTQNNHYYSMCRPAEYNKIIFLQHI